MSLRNSPVYWQTASAHMYVPCVYMNPGPDSRKEPLKEDKAHQRGDDHGQKKNEQNPGVHTCQTPTRRGMIWRGLKTRWESQGATGVPSQTTVRQHAPEAELAILRVRFAAGPQLLEVWGHISGQWVVDKTRLTTNGVIWRTLSLYCWLPAWLHQS